LIRARHVQFEVEDSRVLGDPRLRDGIPLHRVKLWPFQERLVDGMVVKQNALVRSSAGSGKTTAALAFIARTNLPTLVVVHNERLLRQWRDRCVAELGVYPSWVGLVQGKHRRIAPVTLGMQQTLWRCASEIAHHFGVVVVDEVHLAAAATFVSAIDRFPAKYRIGVSDDERRRDRKEFLIYDLFGPVAAEAKYEDLVEDGYILDVEIRVVPTEFEAPWWTEHEERIRAAEEAGEDAKATRLRQDQLAMFDPLYEAMGKDAERNALAVRLVAAECAEAKQALLMSNRRDHVKVVDAMLNAYGVRSGIVLGGQEDVVESDRSVARLKAGENAAAVGTYQAVGTGVDLPKVEIGVCLTPIANSQDGRSQFKQFRGRFARSAKGKGKPRLYYLWDRALYGDRPVRHLCRWTKSVVVFDRGQWRPGREYLKEIT
jgi:superfamily II DNA or RNA helicase